MFTGLFKGQVGFISNTVGTITVAVHHGPLPVVKDFIEKVRVRAVGHEVLKSITPGQQVVKIVHDALVETLGAEAAGRFS